MFFANIILLLIILVKNSANIINIEKLKNFKNLIYFEFILLSKTKIIFSLKLKVFNNKLRYIFSFKISINMKALYNSFLRHSCLNKRNPLITNEKEITLNLLEHYLT
jgi:hypothetical protein